MEIPLRVILKEAAIASTQDQQKLQRPEKNMPKTNKSSAEKQLKESGKLDISSNARQ